MNFFPSARSQTYARTQLHSRQALKVSILVVCVRAFVCERTFGKKFLSSFFSYFILSQIKFIYSNLSVNIKQLAYLLYNTDKNIVFPKRIDYFVTFLKHVSTSIRLALRLCSLSLMFLCLSLSSEFTIKKIKNDKIKNENFMFNSIS